MGTMIQYYTAPSEERAQKLNNDICQAAPERLAFMKDEIVVEPVGPVIDILTSEVSHYGFAVYFDTVDVEGTNVRFQEERRLMNHKAASYKNRKKGDWRFVPHLENSPDSYLPGVLHE